MNLLERPKHNFLRTNLHLGKNNIFLTYGNRYAYGTNVEDSCENTVFTFPERYRGFAPEQIKLSIA